MNALTVPDTENNAASAASVTSSVSTHLQLSNTCGGGGGGGGCDETIDSCGDDINLAPKSRELKVSTRANLRLFFVKYTVEANSGQSDDLQQLHKKA